MDEDQNRQDDQEQEDPNPGGLDLSGIIAALQGSSPAEPAPIEPPPAPAAPPPSDFGGKFGSTYNVGIDAGFTPFGEGLGDNARYGDASKDYRVGTDPTALLENVFGGGGGVMGAGMRGAFDAIARERARTGQEAITPAKFTDMASEGTLTRVYPELDTKTGDVYRVYQYGDKDPRYTKEKVYSAPPKPAAPAGGGRGTGTGGTGSGGGQPNVTAEAASLESDAAARLANTSYTLTRVIPKDGGGFAVLATSKTNAANQQAYDVTKDANGKWVYSAPTQVTIGPGVTRPGMTEEEVLAMQGAPSTLSPSVYGPGPATQYAQPNGYAVPTEGRYVPLGNNAWKDTQSGRVEIWPYDPNKPIFTSGAPSISPGPNWPIR